MTTTRAKAGGFVAGAASLALLLSACGGGPAPTTAPTGNAPEQGGGPQTLTVAVQAWMPEKLGLKAMAEAFQDANPGVTVNLVEYADNQALSTFALQWSQGQAEQDLVVVDGASVAVQFVEQKLIIDFNQTDLFTGDNAKDQFVGESLAFTQLNDNQFAVPIGLEVYNINANKLILAEAGLVGTDGSLPVFNTWQDVYDAAEKITQATGQPGMTIQWGPNAVATMFSVQQAMRGNLYGADGTTLTFDTPEMREMLPIWRKGAEAGIFTTDTFANKDAGRSNFNAGTLAMLLESASRVAEAGQAIGMENTTVLAMPGSLQNGSYGFSAGIIAPSASKNQELALKFLAEGVMSDKQVVAGEEWGKLPVLTRYFNQIDAQWKDDMYSFVSKSVPAPMYKDLTKIQERGKQLLQEYLTGAIDLDQFLTSFDEFIASSDLGS